MNHTQRFAAELYLPYKRAIIEHEVFAGAMDDHQDHSDHPRHLPVVAL